MSPHEKEFLSKLLVTFKGEAEEHVRVVSASVFKLEQTSSTAKSAEIIETIFREIHSLKGAARAVNLRDIESQCQSLENILAGLKSKHGLVSPALRDLLHQAVDGISELLTVRETEDAPATRLRLAALVRQMELLLHEGDRRAPPVVASCAEMAAAPEVPAAPPPLKVVQKDKAAMVETVRVPTAKLEALLLQAEELLSAKLAAEQRSVELQQITDRLLDWESRWLKSKPGRQRQKGAGEVNSQKKQLRNGEEKCYLIAEQGPEWCASHHATIKLLERELSEVTRAVQDDQHLLGVMVDRLLEDMKQVQMLPFGSLVEIIPKLICGLARAEGKEVELVLEGTEIEVDRRVLQEIKDPLIHLVRNCLDHGIERPEERRRKSKPPQGKISICLRQEASRTAEIRISDDGAGIDEGRVRAAALKLGMISAEAAAKLTEPETLALVFRSGLSTSTMISDLSGRGLGLAIVREKVEKLGGHVSVETQPNTGTTFRLFLPLTLATFRGVLVRVNERWFVLPTTHVEGVIRAGKLEVQTVQNRETLRWRGGPISLCRLGDLLELPRSGAVGGVMDHIAVVVLASADERLAVVVDEVIGEQEVLVKSLGPQLVRVRNIAGAAVLGNGRIALILHIQDLLKSAVKAAVAPAPAVQAAPRAKRIKSILVAEDSITTRTLLKSILETAGYAVETAVDGAEAFAMLKTREFDLVVSDVDMPRLNGFGLTAKIRGDKRLEGLPVVLVTAMESRQDREHGIDVGANAYLVKSRFEQGNLLEVVGRLI